MNRLAPIALAALLAVPAQSQIRVGLDVGQAEGIDTRWNGGSAALSVGYQRGLFVGQVRVLEAIAEPLPSSAGADETTQWWGSLAGEVGVSVPLYRGIGGAVRVGHRRYPFNETLRLDAEGTVSSGSLSEEYVAVEAHAPGPARTRLHVRTEFGGALGDGLQRVLVGASVPLRF